MQFGKVKQHGTTASFIGALIFFHTHVVLTSGADEKFIDAQRRFSSLSVGRNNNTTSHDYLVAPPPAARRLSSCPNSCFGNTCEYWITGGYSCTVMETTHGCDCTSCECGADVDDGVLCASSCYGGTCDYWSNNTCSAMESYGCDCSGCTCANDGDAAADDSGACPSSCFGASCDYWLSVNPSYTCPLMETTYSCDCTACDCAAPPSGTPTLSSSPTFSPNPTPTPQTCLSTCYGRSCDGWDTTCSQLEGDYDCDCTGCACDCYEGGCCNTNDGAEGSHGKGCVTGYDTGLSACGAYDTETFSSNDMCCACGGGTSTQEPTLSPTLSDQPTVTSQPTLVSANYLKIDGTGNCSTLNLINDVFAPIARTADGRRYYEGQAQGLKLYYDSDCAGDGSSSAAWIIDNHTPSTDALHDLDGDGRCLYAAEIWAVSGNEPPLGEYDWNVNCNAEDEGWQVMPLSVAVLNPTSIPTATPVPTVTFHPTRKPTWSPSPAPSVTLQPTLVAASYFQVNGSCAYLGVYDDINDVYAPVARTLDGRYFYQGQANGMFLYFDIDVNGGAQGGLANVWVFDYDEPSSTAPHDLDGDRHSYFAGYAQYDEAEPPVGTRTWLVACSEAGFSEIDITISPVSPSLAPSVTPVPSTSRRPTPMPTVVYFVAQTCTELAGILGNLDFDGAVVNVLRNVSCPGAFGIRSVAVRIMSTVGAVIKVDIDDDSESRIFKVGGGARVDVESLTLTEGRLRNLDGGFGGAIYVDGGSTLNMTDVTLRDNIAEVSRDMRMLFVKHVLTLCSHAHCLLRVAVECF